MHTFTDAHTRWLGVSWGNCLQEGREEGKGRWQEEPPVTQKVVPTRSITRPALRSRPGFWWWADIFSQVRKKHSVDGLPTSCSHVSLRMQLSSSWKLAQEYLGTESICNTWHIWANTPSPNSALYQCCSSTGFAKQTIDKYIHKR